MEIALTIADQAPGGCRQRNDPAAIGRPVASRRRHVLVNISDTPLTNYLYGFSMHWYLDAEGQLVVTRNLYMRRFVLGWKKLGLERSLGTYADDLVILCRRGNAERRCITCARSWAS